MEIRFNEFKEEILKRAKEASACRAEYGRAYASETFAELIQVIKDNFWFAVGGKVIEPTIIETYKDEFSANQIFFNVNCSSGYLLVGNATVKASGNATVEASGNATVKAWGNATVEASGNATVEAWGNATVEAWDNATVEAWGNAYITSYLTVECKLSDNTIYRIRESNTIRYTSDNIKFERV